MRTTISCAVRVDTVEIDELMERILAVMLVPYPPGIRDHAGRAGSRGDEIVADVQQ